MKKGFSKSRHCKKGARKSNKRGFNQKSIVDSSTWKKIELMVRIVDIVIKLLPYIKKLLFYLLGMGSFPFLF